jgi:outer membrane protein/S-layer protein transport system outer membrane protein
MKEITRLVASTSLATLAMALTAQAARAETLADAVAYAYETNPGLQAQRASLRALDETYVQARAGFAPNITASAAATSYHERLLGQSFYANTDSETLALVQPLYAGGKLRAHLTEAEAQILAGREALRRYEMDLLQRVVAAYVGVQRDEEIWKINQDTVEVLERDVADNEARFAVREVTMTDVAISKARLANARSALANAQGTLAVTQAQFTATVGQPPGDLAPPPELDAVPATIDQAFDAAEANNPQLSQAKYTEQRSRARIAEAKAAALPSISAQLALQHTPFLPYATSQGYNYAGTAMVTLSQSIFSGGQIASQVHQSIEENNSDRLSIDDTRNQVILGVSTAWEQLSLSRSQIKSYDDEVKADEFSFYGNREEQKMALRSTIEVLNAELELTTAQQNLVRARATEYIARAQLLEAMGILTPAALSSRVAAYDPAENFRHVRHRGETPLEWPVRALDSIVAPRIGPNPPASIAEAHRSGTPMPPAPTGEGPIRSILSTLESPPPEPK